MDALTISSLSNDRIKRVVKLRQRSRRDDTRQMLIEGYRELRRAVDNGHTPCELFIGRDFFLGDNNAQLVDDCSRAGALLYECTRDVFRKISYRDRPDGFLAVAPQVGARLDDVALPDAPLIVVAEAVEKPGNLGTVLRTADAVGAAAVLVCDRCTDINNPNVVRASVGTVFSVPVVEVTSAEALQWLHGNGIRCVAATPHTETIYYDADLRGGIAIVVGTEQYGLSDTWLANADIRVRLPMLGQADSLNVASATSILLYEALRQRELATRTS